MAKKAVKKVVAKQTVPQDENVEGAIIPMKTEYTDDEITALIEQGQELYAAEHGAGTEWVPRFKITRELAIALLTRNASNRFPNPKVINEYTKLWLTNTVDEHGEPVKGTTQWVSDLAIDVAMSDSGNLHNSQKCLRALINAQDMLELNQQEILNKKAGVTDLQAELGITPEDVMPVGILRTGFDDEQADLIDTAQQRRNADRAYRRHLFDDMDFDFMRKAAGEGSTAESLAKLDASHIEKLPAVKNRLSKYLESVLNYVSRRLWDKGRAPRSTPTYGKLFTPDRFAEALKTFPDAAESVYSVFKMMKSNGVTFQQDMKKLASPEYFMASHYLASMSDATYDKKSKTWVRADDGLAWGDAFIEQIVSKKDLSEIVEWRSKVMAMKDRSDKDLNAIWHSLTYCWRLFAFEEAMPQLQLLLAGSVNYANYSRESDADSFDKIPAQTPSQADIEAANKSKGKGKTATSVVASPAASPAGGKRPNFARK